MLYYEDRRPLYCATESHRTVSSGLFLGLLEARFEWSMRGWLRRQSGDSCAMLCSPLFLFLIEIPLRRRPYGRRKGALDRELRTVTLTRILIRLMGSHTDVDVTRCPH